MNNNLKIAIIGDPNKGKSSLVSTLAYDDNIKISSKSGETTISKCFPLKIDDEIIYELYDTPGFDNYEELLDFNDENKDKYTDFDSLLEAFIKKYENNEEYKKDIEIYKILRQKPIILYLINSSESYRSEYQSQIDIITKTNLPSFAIFNQIGEEDNKHTWESITKLYFIDSLDYNVLNSSFKDKIRLLESMKLKIEDSKIKEQLSHSILILNKDFQRRIKFTFEELVDSFYKIITYKKEFTYTKNSQNHKNDFFKDIKKQEDKFYNIIAKEWGFYNLNSDIQKLKRIEIDSENFTKIFGLPKSTLIAIATSLGAVSGGSIGFGVDLFGSMGLGTLLGSGIGAISAGTASLIGTELISKKTKGFGVKEQTVYGPITNLNWRMSLFTKLYLFSELIAQRSHANRSDFKNQDNAEEIFDDKKEILKLAKKNSDTNKKELMLILEKTYERRQKN
ncbi:DUF3482 domain-containing protein [Poseidonibacter antarcticus]|uniref:DUF3482 domain-containing protein n=1 Tax=Poseidonibacter antarcticus TaxID=2478538 RepID=UPI000EF49A9B|nr:DUF3482 domain-containing protein [Poseidonibacter antarcticus]